MAGRDNVGPMEEFVARHDLGHVDHIADVDGSVWLRNEVVGQPAWVFIDGETGAAKSVFGAIGEDGLNAEIDALSG